MSATALYDHVRLTALDKPFTCSCDPDTSDASQSWTDHAITVLARNTPHADAEAFVEWHIHPSRWPDRVHRADGGGDHDECLPVTVARVIQPQSSND